jgi:hypothetical protein
VVDEAVDVFGAEAAAARLAARLDNVQRRPVRVTEDAQQQLWPPFAAHRDRVEAPALGRSTLVVFGAHGTPWSRPLGRVLAHVRDVGTVRLAWRHFPDPTAHPRAAILALATEAVATRGQFWVVTRSLLEMRHHDPADLHAALLHAGLDPDRMVDAMRAGTGADRIVDDVTSALSSGVTHAPALFINGERYRGELQRAAVSAALETAGPPR